MFTTECHNNKGRWMTEICLTSCKPIFEFFEHYKVKYTTPLFDVMKDFEVKPTVELQKQIRFFLCKEVTFNEDIRKIKGLYSTILESCEKAYYNMLSKKEVLHE